MQKAPATACNSDQGKEKPQQYHQTRARPVYHGQALQDKEEIKMTTTEKKEYTIRDIEALTEAQAAAMAIESVTVKGHQVYFVDFGSYFGYSALVFADGHHIKYADDYELHHTGKSRDELREFYLTASAKTIHPRRSENSKRTTRNKKAKEYYIRNYYGLHRDHISMFSAAPIRNGKS